MIPHTSSPFSSPFSTPFGQVEIPQPPSVVSPQQGSPDDVKNLMRCVNYLADYSGCGLWRMLWPEHVLNAHHKALCQSSSIMITNPEFYHNVKIIRIQRQATPHQLEFVKFLKNVI